MHKYISPIKAILLLLLFSSLVGCATTKNVSSPYNNSNNRYIQAMDLPEDYPTKYLPDGNMWNDFKSDLQLPVDTSNPAIKTQIRWYQNHQSFINNSIVRGAPFLFYAYEETKKLHLPAELALIPIGESGFIPSNRSNKGAFGLWQFMPNTAASFNLKMNKYYDGRLDPIASTNAALKYFTYLYYFFDNDWLLAIAAYNTGPGNVQRSIFNNQRHNLPKNFWALNLPRDTEVYIPKLLALAAIIKNPKKYGVYLTPINNSLYFEQVNVGHQITLNEVAKFSDSKMGIIRSLNPAYTQGATPPNGPYTVLVPKNKSSIFQKRANLSQPSSLEETPEKVNPETKLEETANAQPESATTAITSASVPATSGIPTDMQYNNEKANISDQEMGISDNTAKAQEQQPRYIKYTVKKKDTLYKIARKFRTSTTSLRKINKLKNNAVKPGQRLLVPNKEENLRTQMPEINQTPAAMPNTTKKQKTNDNENLAPVEDQSNANLQRNLNSTNKKHSAIKTIKHTVTASDTIYSIARQFNTSPESVKSLNKLASNNIKPGQILKIEGNSATESSGTLSTSHNSKKNKSSTKRKHMAFGTKSKARKH